MICNIFNRIHESDVHVIGQTHTHTHTVGDGLPDLDEIVCYSFCLIYASLLTGPSLSPPPPCLSVYPVPQHSVRLNVRPFN